MAASPADKEVLDYQVPRRILNLVETTCSAFRLDEKQIRILDFGCGRGKTLARLRQMGLDVRGVDIDRQRAKDARGLLSRLDAGSDDDVAVINGDGKIPFADEYFHCVYSQQVFEHVRDLSAAIGEISRVTMGRGKGHHVLSPPFRLVEEHLRMPFVHWIPPGVLRFPLILFLLACGVDPSWPNLAGLSLWQRALGYWRYSTDHLFFRRWGRIQGSSWTTGFSPGCWLPGTTRHTVSIRCFCAQYPV